MVNLTDLGIELPRVAAPIGAYVPAVRAGNLVFCAGQLPLVDGVVPSAYTGKVGYNITIDTAKDAARQAALNVLAILEAEVGLANVVRIARVTVHVACTPIFTEHSKVAYGASELFGQVFGDAGKHARLALGSIVLPLDACVEVEVIAEVR
jgi:enamine deaminase RidA (YjgF/YER057c/UK114 family)